MDFKTFFIALFSIKLLCFLINWMGSKKQSDYLGGEKISFFPLTLTLLGAILGGGSVIGSSEEAFTSGWLFIAYPLGFCFGFILKGIGSGKKLYDLKITTIAQIFQAVYGSVGLKKIAAFLSVCSLFLILIVQLIATKKFFMALGLANPLIFYGFWLVVFSYAILGGFKAVLISHMIQSSFITLVLFATIFFANPSLSLQSLSFDVGMPKLTGWFFMPVFFFLISQDIGQRCFAAKSRKTVLWSCVTAGIFLLLIMTIPIYWGHFAKLEQIEVSPGSSVLMTVLSLVTNPVMTALVGSAVLAATTSCAESLINAVSSNIYADFNLGKYVTPKWISLVIALFSLFISAVFQNIIDIVILSYELSICILFVPIAIAFFKTEGNSISAWYATSVGAILFVFFRWVVSVPPMGYQFYCIGFSLIAFFIGEWQARTVATLQR